MKEEITGQEYGDHLLIPEPRTSARAYLPMPPSHPLDDNTHGSGLRTPAFVYSHHRRVPYMQIIPMGN